MKTSLTRWGAVALVALAMAGCGSDSGDSSTPVAPPPGSSVAAAISAAAAVPGNDTSINSAAPFTVLQGAGVPAVTVNGPPKVNFTIFSDGKVKEGLKVTAVSAIIAKLIPGTNGNPDEWRSYTHRTRTAATPVAGVVYSPWLLETLTNPAFPSRTNAGVDPKQTDAALLAAQLAFNADGYYTYNFSTDIKDPAKTNGVTFEPGLTHRVAIQVTYTNAAGQSIAANPYFDFTVGADGKSVTVTDPSKTRKMTDVASCNGCHEKLTAHGSRIDTQYCVTCHNPNSVDANSGNSLNLVSMIHKIHSARLLASQAATGGGEFVTIRSHDYAEVGFPQDLRNCAVCHSASNPNTPQGDNWKTKVSKDACLTCHANNAGSSWNVSHTTYFGGSDPKTMTNAQCVACHNPTSNPTLSPERVHWNQNEENAALYKMNIEDVSYTPSATTGGTSTVTVKYFVSNPTKGNAAYDLTASSTGTACTGSGASISCNGTTTFGNLRFYLAYQNMKGQSAATTEFSAYNNNGNSGTNGNAYAYKGINDGTNHYTVALTVPADSTFTAAFGTARVVSIGQVKEVKLAAKSAADPRPPVSPLTIINTVMQHTYKDVVLSGASQPRREIVSNDKCNVCHGALGATSGSNTLANAFHSGARNTVESCVICHDANRVSSTVMTSGIVDQGVGLNEAYQMKRMIHGIHGNSKRTTPFTHGNVVVGAFDKTGKLITAGSFLADYKVKVSGVDVVAVPAGTPVAVGTTFDGIAQIIDSAARAKGYTGTFIASAENYAAEVAYPQVGLNCDACHVNGSWKQDLGTLGAVVSKAGGSTSDPNSWKVISPKAASCTSCHDSSAAIGHVVSFGGSRFGSATQTAIAGLPRETCNDCHSPGGVKGVDIVHGQK